MSSSLIITADSEGLRDAAEAISRGELIAFPTETVYGLGANALNEKAVLSIFEAKGRPLTDPLIVHVPDFPSAINLVSIDDQTENVFRMLASEFWPGPLTVILKAASCIPSVITAGSGFVGIRIPSHPLAIAFLRACQLPVAAPSANRFGHVSPTLAQHVVDDLGQKRVRVLDGDSGEQHSGHTCLHGIESTVVKIDAEQRKILVLRQGAIGQREIERLLSANGEDGQWAVESLHRTVAMPEGHSHASEGGGGASAAAVAVEAPQEGGEVAPGQLVTHYAPDVTCFVLASCRELSGTGECGRTSSIYPSGESDQQAAVALSLARYSRVSRNISRDELAGGTVVIDFGGQLQWLADKCLRYRDLSSTGNSVEAAQAIFSVLRWAEVQESAKLVIIAPIIIMKPEGRQCSDDVAGKSVNSSVVLESRNKSFDPSLGLADRIFRSASAVALDLVIMNS